MSKWKCNDCAETEGFTCPCVVDIPLASGASAEFCPLTGEECDWYEVEEK
jgi:hypothetical protein